MTFFGRSRWLPTRRRLAPALACAVGMIGGCAGLNPVARNPANFAPWVAEEETYRLKPGDELEVKLPFTPELNDRQQIGPDGTITLPLIGSTRAAGRSLDELTGDLRQHYRRHLRDPEVHVVPRTFGSQKIFVGGEVTRPGLLDLPGRIGVIEAITMAGGLTEKAGADDVAVIRRNAQGVPMLRIVNLKAFVADPGGADVPLRGFDMVFVPRSSIAEVDLFIDQYINKVLPFDRSASYSITK